MRTTAIACCLLWLALLAAGCHKLLGDYTLEGSTGCASGAVQCVGNVLQGCNSEGTGWSNLSVCASGALCDAVDAKCLPPLCASGQRRCNEAELQVCNATRDGWDNLQACASAPRCSAESGSCTDEPCAPGSRQCNGTLIQSCKDDQSGWDVLDECESTALCNKELGKCDAATCKPGEFHCDGAQLQKCNDLSDGWDPVGTCDSEVLCDDKSGKCGTAGCTTPGAFRCADAALQRCADDLTGWVAMAECQSAAYCDSVNGVCMDMPCAAGSRQCNGATLAVCSADRASWAPLDTCQTDGLCQVTLSGTAVKCAPPACATGETKCVAEQPQICNAGRSDFRANGAACATPELCNAGTGTCTPPVCAAGETRCNAAQPEICNKGRTDFVANGAACASAALCNASTGTCGAQKCVAGQLRCDPASSTHLQRCKADLTDWEATPCDVCATPELCSASLSATTCDQTSCKEPACTAGEPRCGGSGADTGKVLEMCSAGRTGYTSCQTCATTDLCDVSLNTKPFSCTPTACTAPSCALTDRWCGGTDNKTLYQCPVSRINSRATALDTCATNGLCEATHQKGTTTCDKPTCALTDLWCAGTGNKTLYQCPASRINSQATNLGTCTTAGLCDLSRVGGKTSCEAPQCKVGATQCGGTGKKTLQACNADQTGFSDCDTCSTAELCTDSLGAKTCDASACLACATGEARCNASGNYETCNAARTGFDVTSCMGNGCDVSQGGCLAPATGGTGGSGGTGP